MSKPEILMEYITRDMVDWLMKDDNIPMSEALQRVYSSQTFEKLTDAETGLYLESAASLYDLYQTEQQYGSLVQLEV